MMNNKLALFSIILAVVALGFLVYVKATDGVITVCVGQNGLMYFVGEGITGTKCDGKGKIVSWNIQGPPGPPGPPGRELHLYDANGQDLGLLIDSVAYSRARLTTLSSGYFVEFYQDDVSKSVSWRGGESQRVYFDNGNCVGNVYIVETPGPGYFIRVAGRFFDTPSPDLQFGLTLRSHFDPNGECVNESTDHGVPAREISNPFPFGDPLAWPLRIQ